MRSKLAIGTILVATLVAAAPAWALQTVLLPQPPGDNTSNAQNPDSPPPTEFGTQQSDGQPGDFGAFHFHMNSGSDWPGDPYHFEHQQNSIPDAYGNAATPGSEFSTGNIFYPH